ncbi:MAG: dihydropteroate synthase [Planctomycetota bacterium]
MSIPKTSEPVLMGVLNLTPDSFSDGGRFVGVDEAVAQGLALARAGAGFVDVGGESTRPGSGPVGVDEQLRRAVEPIRALRAALDGEGFGEVVISIDTTLAGVGAMGLDAGAGMLNDVSAGRDPRNTDPAGGGGSMFELAAERGVPLVLMHMLGEPGTMQDAPVYGDVVAEVLDFLMQRVAAAQAAGVAEDKLLIDPGIGFGKTLEHNLELLANLDRFVATGYPVLLGASRKRFIEHASLATCAGEPAASARLGGTIAATLAGLQAGVSIVRVHDVRENRQALDLAAAIGGAGR